LAWIDQELGEMPVRGAKEALSLLRLLREMDQELEVGVGAYETLKKKWLLEPEQSMKNTVANMLRLSDPIGNESK
jgi:hypothetical protein